MLIGILTYNRKELLEETMKSLINHNNFQDIKVILVDNGSDYEHQIYNKECAKLYNAEYIYNEIEITDDINRNIEIGHFRLISEMIKRDSELYCILEDDWKCIGTFLLDDMITFLKKYAYVGQIRVRDFHYDDSFYGGSSVNFVTMEKICFDENININNASFKCADMHWVNSCCVMTIEAMRYMEKELFSEEEKMRYFYKKYSKNAQLDSGIFYHIGPVRIREDLREKGLFLNEDISSD